MRLLPPFERYMASEGISQDGVIYTVFSKMPWIPAHTDFMLGLGRAALDYDDDTPVALLPGWFLIDETFAGNFYISESDLAEAVEIALSEYNQVSETYEVDFAARKMALILLPCGVIARLFSDSESVSGVVEPEMPPCGESDDHTWREVSETYGEGAGLRTAYECTKCGVSRSTESDAKGDGTMTFREKIEK